MKVLFYFLPHLLLWKFFSIFCHIYYFESSFLFSATSTTLKVLFYFLPHLLLWKFSSIFCHIYYFESSFVFSATSTTLKVLFATSSTLKVFFLFSFFLPHLLPTYFESFNQYRSFLSQRPLHVQWDAGHPGYQGGGPKKRIIGKKWRAEEEERHKGSLTQKKIFSFL
jgi:hypothetical protein